MHACVYTAFGIAQKCMPLEDRNYMLEEIKKSISLLKDKGAVIIIAGQGSLLEYDRFFEVLAFVLFGGRICFKCSQAIPLIDVNLYWTPSY